MKDESASAEQPGSNNFLGWRELRSLSRAALQDLYLSSPAGVMPQGRLEGIGLPLPGTRVGRGIAAAFRAFVWKGKHFEPERGEILNVLSPFELRSARGELSIGAGTLDGKPSIIIDYSSTMTLGRPVRDEIREVAPGLYLGRAFFGSRPSVFFALARRGLMDPLHEVFRGKVALVTGGASGFGRCLCEELARRGAIVIVADLHEAGAKDVAAAIERAGGRAHAERIDVASHESVDAVVQQVLRQFSRLDCMFNNAGIAVAGEHRDVDLVSQRRMLAVNLDGVLHGIQAVYQSMVASGSGHIVNTASISGLAPTPFSGVYAATKHAVVGLSTSLRAEAADLGVRVSVICPGPMRTPFMEKSEAVNLDRERLASRLLHRLPGPEPCARAALDAIARNRGIILVGGPAPRLLWWAYRLAPNLVVDLARHFVRRLRRLRIDA